MPIPADIDAQLTGEFKKGMIAATISDPAGCLFFYCCGPCSVYDQRRTLLSLTGEPYVMCAGTCPCLGFEQPCPESLLMVESCCLMGNAMGGNRWMTHSRLNVKNTGLENFCQIFNFCVSCEFCIMRLCCDCSKEREDLVKAACCGCACMHCQNAAEIDAFRKSGKAYPGPPAGLVTALPNHFATVGVTTAAVAPVQMAPM